VCVRLGLGGGCRTHVLSKGVRVCVAAQDKLCSIHRLCWWVLGSDCTAHALYRAFGSAWLDVKDRWCSAHKLCAGGFREAVALSWQDACVDWRVRCLGCCSTYVMQQPQAVCWWVLEGCCGAHVAG
jgi:hypothetical protein